MSSTPLSGNVIRRPTGLLQWATQQILSCLDVRCAASRTRHQHTLIIWLMLFVYIQIQRSFSRYRATRPHTMGPIIGCWLWKLGGGVGGILIWNDESWRGKGSGLGSWSSFPLSSLSTQSSQLHLFTQSLCHTVPPTSWRRRGVIMCFTSEKRLI